MDVCIDFFLGLFSLLVLQSSKSIGICFSLAHFGVFSAENSTQHAEEVA